MLDIKYVIGDGWEGIYIYNMLVYEAHNIKFEQGFGIVCDHINEVESPKHIQFSIYSIDQDWLENEGKLPENFEDIPSYLLENWD